jgi:hypothetical protein
MACVGSDRCMGSGLLATPSAAALAYNLADIRQGGSVGSVGADRDRGRREWWIGVRAESLLTGGLKADRSGSNLPRWSDRDGWYGACRLSASNSDPEADTYPDTTADASARYANDVCR